MPTGWIDYLPSVPAHRYRAFTCLKINYLKPDSVISFARLALASPSNANHEERQPVHLQLKNANVPTKNLPPFANQRLTKMPAEAGIFISTTSL
jgi:hypothetical protein